MHRNKEFLNSHSEEAKEYESLKLSLLSEFQNNRDGYTLQKTEFVRKIVSKARMKSFKE